MQKVKVSKRLQISVPAEARKELCIEPGDYLYVEVRNGTIVLSREPRDYVKEFRGLGSEIWKDLDVEEYIKSERDAWTK